MPSRVGRWLIENHVYVTKRSASLWLSCGKPWLSSCHRRRPLAQPRWFDLPDPIVPPQSPFRSERSIIFLPFLNFEHFGHLLTETAAWLSPLLAKTPADGIPDQILLGSWAAGSAESLAKLLCWEENRIRTTSQIQGLTQFSEVWLPVPTMVNRDRVDSAHCLSVRRLLRRLHGLPLRAFVRPPHSDSAPKDGQKVYLSRSGLDSNQRRIRGEVQLETALIECGWRVVHPETLSLAQQLSHLRNALVIAGPLGSAFHLLFPFGVLTNGPLLLTLGFPAELTTPGPGQNFGLQFTSQKLLVRHLPLLALEDSSLDPYKAARNQSLCFSNTLDEVVEQLENHARVFIAAVPQ